jgi:spore germination cell wall hydrolase CwlJ-like protein
MENVAVFHSDQEALVKLSKGLTKALGFLVVMSALFMVTSAKLNALRHVDEPSFASAAEKTKQLDCLARNVYYEAGNEPFEGKVLVAQVTIQRVETGRFAKDICGVVNQRNVIMEKVVCQFSWLCDGTAKIKPVHNAAYKESEDVAKRVLFENFRMPGFKEALYYHATYVNPNWNRERIGTVGQHIYYK